MIIVVDDVVPPPELSAYRERILAGSFIDTPPLNGKVFHGINPHVSDFLPAWITNHFSLMTPVLTFARLSPLGQEEPNYIHSDADMGDWTAILYLTADPPPDDGTIFWRHIPTGDIMGDMNNPAYDFHDMTQWEQASHVWARPNRLVIFPSSLFHSRSIHSNYGSSTSSRLIQVVFGKGKVQASSY